MSSARLCGADHRELGEIASVAQGTAAIALSRGGAAKRYAHRDPNEDAAGFALSQWGALAVVADGHAGCTASQVTVDRVLEVHADRWLAAAPVALDARFLGEALDVVLDVNAAILQATTGSDSDQSRTTLALALLRPGDGWMAALSLGDSHVFAVDASRTRELVALGGERASFLGEPAYDASRLRKALRAEYVPLEGLRAVVLATDGLSERGIGVEDPGGAVAEAVHAAAGAASDLRALDAARGVVQRALAAQQRQRSGDNVAVAVLWRT